MPEVTYKFDDLSDSAKRIARGKFLEGGYPHYDWWDFVYDGAVRMAKLLGIEISTSTRLLGANGRVVKDIDISFSGFSSQGDGACFKGSYRFTPDAVKAIAQETTDEELNSIAQQLTILQVTRRMKGWPTFYANIGTRGSYNHSGTITVSVEFDEEPDDDEDDAYELEQELTTLMRAFADWIYSSLEDEYDYLRSGECVDEQLQDLEFDEDGLVV